MHPKPHQEAIIGIAHLGQTTVHRSNGGLCGRYGHDRGGDLPRAAPRSPSVAGTRQPAPGTPTAAGERCPCMPYRLSPSPGGARRRPVRCLPATTLAGCGRAPPGAWRCWLLAWLPGNSLAPLMFDLFEHSLRPAAMPPRRHAGPRAGRRRAEAAWAVRECESHGLEHAVSACGAFGAEDAATESACPCRPGSSRDGGRLPPASSP